ncbi:MAG: vWA domain-containing protein [Phycisphaerae bacterium]|nr:vWA domain-containing protein [Phycisphaerae bacterium]
MKNAIVITVLTFTIAAVLLCSAPVQAKSIAPVPEKPSRRVDLVICLDTSGSMSGLIQSAKQKLWAVVNELATARPRPVLRVALYHYGNDGLKAENGWVKQLCPLTDDLDKVYENLFKLTTNGGTELVARVMRAATEELKWDKSKNTLRMMFIAGNEAATQDKVHKLRDTCKAAATAGIIVNTIHCGPEATGRRGGWADAAAWADGQYAAIDHDRGTVVINTPHDKKLAELSSKINSTYIGYGRAGKAGLANQLTQDSNASGLNAPAAAQRASAKAGGLYNAAGWDLVDASKKKDFDITKIKKEDLPESMRKMTDDEKKAHIAKQSASRVAIQKEIMELTKKRDAYVKAEMARKGLDEKTSFDAALRKMVRVQAEKQNFKFEK